jgi:hypothetical protein
MNPIESLNEKGSEEQSTPTNSGLVPDGGRVDTNGDSDGDGGDGGDSDGGDSGDSDDDGDSEDDDDDSAPLRRTKVNRDADGEPLGAAVWVNADELAALGVDPAVTDQVGYRVENEALHVDPAGTDDTTDRGRR